MRTSGRCADALPPEFLKASIRAIRMRFARALGSFISAATARRMRIRAAGSVGSCGLIPSASIGESTWRQQRGGGLRGKYGDALGGNGEENALDRLQFKYSSALLMASAAGCKEAITPTVLLTYPSRAFNLPFAGFSLPTSFRASTNIDSSSSRSTCPSS